MLDLQTCWYGDLNDTTKGWMGRKGGGHQIGGPLCPPAVRPRCLQEPETLQSCVSFALSERAIRCHGQSSVPRLRSGALVAAVTRKAETTKHGPVGDAGPVQRLAPGVGCKGVAQHGSDKGRAESCNVW